MAIKDTPRRLIMLSITPRDETRREITRIVVCNKTLASLAWAYYDIYDVSAVFCRHLVDVKYMRNTAEHPKKVVSPVQALLTSGWIT